MVNFQHNTTVRSEEYCNPPNQDCHDKSHQERITNKNLSAECCCQVVGKDGVSLVVKIVLTERSVPKVSFVLYYTAILVKNRDYK